jgi:hypothetical protein
LEEKVCEELFSLLSLITDLLEKRCNAIPLQSICGQQVSNPTSMKPFIFLMALAISLSACSSATDPDTTPDPVLHAPVISRAYDAARGGVQITQIYFHQDSNRIVYGLEDEWVVLESDATRSIEGWQLNAGDAGQSYDLPDTMHRKLIIYTHAGTGAATDTTWPLGLSSGKWIWNNSDPDTAWVFDRDGAVIDSMTYRAK